MYLLYRNECFTCKIHKNYIRDRWRNYDIFSSKKLVSIEFMIKKKEKLYTVAWIYEFYFLVPITDLHFPAFRTLWRIMKEENDKHLVIAENAAVKTNNDTASVCHLRKENHMQDLVSKKVYRTCQDRETLPSPPTLWPCRAGLTTKIFIYVMAVYFTSHWLLHLACITAGLHQVMGGTRATYLLWVKMKKYCFGLIY